MKLSDFTFSPHKAQPEAASAAEPDSSQSTVSQLFDRAAGQWGTRLALRDAHQSMTYAELDRFSARLAHLLQSVGVGPERFVGIMTGRSNLFIAGMLGVLRAGGAYAPIDPALPLDRRRDMLISCQAVALLSSSSFLREMNNLQWECPDLNHIVCLDAENFHELCEPPGELMSTELWDYVAGQGEDDIQAGGWKSPYTGQWLSREIMEGFGHNARIKLQDRLGPEQRVLEIGCASGITMRHVAPLCQSYLGVDITEPVLDQARREVLRQGLGNVTLRRLRADQIDQLPAGSFDCVIMNSVLECFPGLNYLRRVLDLCLERLVPGGCIFVGNAWDLERRDALVKSLEDFARENVGQGYNTKTDMSGELFVSQAFFRNWAAGRDQGLSLEFSAMQADERELAAYGYDLLISKQAAKGHPSQPVKGAWALSDFAGLPATPPAVTLKGEHAAYAIFTSGTTGGPKGAVLEHGNLVNLIQSLDQRVLEPLTSTPGREPNKPLDLAVIANFSFDASLQNIFGSLLGGHTLHLVSDQARRDPALVHAFLEERGIDLADGTPSLFSMLLDYWETTGSHSQVRTFLLGGEVLRPRHLQRFYAIAEHASCRVVNAYGPTECCVDATLHCMDRLSWQDYPTIPIGTPVKGTEILIIDAKGRELPPGVAGEILITGACVGRGYLNSPELTAQRFVPHPRRPGLRAYRTGDLGRWRQEGVLEYIQREDAQVKVRGYRVECGEIENALLTYPGIRQAAVTAGDFLNDGVPSLAAYLVAQDNPSADGLREHLMRKLPQYMVPSYFVILEQLPLTHSGKIDLRSLPSPVSQTAASQEAHPPQTPTEKLLAPLWAKLLQLNQVDTDADFFSQGGHSILAVRLVSLIDRDFGVRLSLDKFFLNATIRKVAAMIDGASQSAGSPAWSPLITARAQGDLPPLFCFHPVGGNILCYQNMARLLGPNQPVYMIQSLGLEEGQEPLGSVEEMAACYLEAILGAFPSGPYALAGWSFGGLVAWEVARRLMEQGQSISALALLDTVALPHGINQIMSAGEAELLEFLFRSVLPLDLDELRAMTPQQRQDHIMALGRESGVFPPDVDRGLVGRLFNLYKHNGLAAMRYRPPALDLPVLLVLPRELSSLNLTDDPLQGWGDLARGGVSLHPVPGNHGDMLYPPQVDALVAGLEPHLRQGAARMGKVRHGA